MLLEIGRSLGLIPFESDHTYIVLRDVHPSRGALTNEANRPRLHRGDERSRGSENEERERKTMRAGSELSGGLGACPDCF